MLRASRGVTLIELIIGIVVLGISLSLITSILGPLYVRSVDPWHQIRAAELGHSLMNEILGKAFDENSNRSGGPLRCDEDGGENCSCTATEVVLTFYRCTAGSNYSVFGPNGETRSQFNDVDDYHGLVQSGADISNIFGSGLADAYREYTVRVQVDYAGVEVGMGGSNEANRLVKRINVSVTTPSGDVIDFAAYKGNW